MVQESTSKKVLSTKVTTELKDKLVKQAKEKGLTTSEFIANILAIDFKEQENQQKIEIEKLKSELKDKDELILNLSNRLEKEQNLLGQQQQLQLMAQQQINDMQKNQQLLIENTSKKKWWQIFK